MDGDPYGIDAAQRTANAANVYPYCVGGGAARERFDPKRPPTPLQLRLLAASNAWHVSPATKDPR